jgi:hypothetical protein
MIEFRDPRTGVPPDIVLERGAINDSLSIPYPEAMSKAR